MGERPWWGQGLRMLRPLAAPAAARFSLGSEATPLAVRPLIASPVVHAGVLDAAECERVKAMAEKRGFSPSNSAYGEADSRRCRSTWLLPEDDAHWLYAKVGACIERANERFGFAVNGFLEPVMVARYGPGDHFDWHLDIGPELAANRKLSVSLLLDPPGEYEGGDLGFAGAASALPRLERGSAVVFPSYLAHRITPVARGRRDALVAFAYGPSFT